MRLRSWIQQRGETYDALARAWGVSVTAVGNILNGRTANVRLVLLEKISQHTGIPLGDLATELLGFHYSYQRQQAQLAADQEKDLI